MPIRFNEDTKTTTNEFFSIREQIDLNVTNGTGVKWEGLELFFVNDANLPQSALDHPPYAHFHWPEAGMLKEFPATISGLNVSVENRTNQDNLIAPRDLTLRGEIANGAEVPWSTNTVLHQIQNLPTDDDFTLYIRPLISAEEAAKIPTAMEPVKPGPDDPGFDWNALAERVLRYYEATGSWGLLSEWLSDNPPDKGWTPPSGEREVDWNLLSERVEDYYADTGQWGLLEDWLSPPPPAPDGGPMDYII